MNRIEVLEELKRYYSAELAEDKQDGTSFDCAVLDAIDNLIAIQRTQQTLEPECNCYKNNTLVWERCPVHSYA